MLVIGTAYAVYALSLLFQPARWSKTPAYHNLLAIMPAPAWGIVFAVIAAAMAGAVAFPRRRWLAVIALTAALAITLPWTGAFVVRWATSDSTTPETWVSWAVNAFLIIRAAVLLEEKPGGEGPGDGG
jgi:hypothetical protein